MQILMQMGCFPSAPSCGLLPTKQQKESIPLFGGTQPAQQQENGIPLFGEYLVDFQKAFKSKLKPTTKETYHQMIRKYILPRWGNMPLNQIKTDMIQYLYDEMADAGNM